MGGLPMQDADDEARAERRRREQALQEDFARQRVQVIDDLGRSYATGHQPRPLLVLERWGHSNPCCQSCNCRCCVQCKAVSPYTPPPLSQAGTPHGADLPSRNRLLTMPVLLKVCQGFAASVLRYCIRMHLV